MEIKAKGITATVVFESSAVNGDEKLSENITSIKKLSRINGTYSFLSRAFIRHHMFSTLNQLFDWKPAPVKMDRSVIQFSFPMANIVLYPEVDLFGFMCTSPDTVSRKAPLGITKAISLEPWQGDMAFYANHDMVSRAREQGEKSSPNLYNKEEHYSYYRVSFTLDLTRLGLHDWYFTTPTEKNKKAIINWRKKLKKWIIDNFPKVAVEDVKKVIVRNKVIWEEKKAQGLTWYKIDDMGFVGMKEEKQEEQFMLRFLLTDEEYTKRVQQVLTVIKDGFIMHSSTENYGVNPVFIVAATLKVPAPVFNSAIKIGKDGGIDTTPINKTAENSHIIKAWYWNNSTLPLIGTLSDKLNEWAGIGEILKNGGLKIQS
ncbi:MAG: type I-B CRISPR-associated protein Cas7/Cst2/DevR [Thermoanaerobacteraceae bacterium]|nr:type I-B CRISPR-associated protein Cas7/Cst2/DevR [Thermoanaerobacteraceae bacterium]